MSHETAATLSNARVLSEFGYAFRLVIYRRRSLYPGYMPFSNILLTTTVIHANAKLGPRKLRISWLYDLP